MTKVSKRWKAVDVNVESIRRVATKAKVSQAPQATFALGIALPVRMPALLSRGSYSHAMRKPQVGFLLLLGGVIHRYPPST